jgi:hypothetical protein
MGIALCYTRYTEVLTTLQEFSIEIPDKDADAIHSGECSGSSTRSFWC